MNLAQCALLLGNPKRTIELCNRVLAVDQNNAKALFRRGSARLEVVSSPRELEEAMVDLSNADAIAPSDVIKRKFLVAKKRLGEYRRWESKIYRNIFRSEEHEEGEQGET